MAWGEGFLTANKFINVALNTTWSESIDGLLTVSYQFVMWVVEDKTLRSAS